MADTPIHSEPALVEAIDGSVVMDCPDASENRPHASKVRMTPAAAEETSERLLEGAMKARGQSYFARDRATKPAPHPRRR
jgi:hypothetical protein